MADPRLSSDERAMVFAIVAVLALVVGSDVLELVLARKVARKRAGRLLAG